MSYFLVSSSIGHALFLLKKKNEKNLGQESGKLNKTKQNKTQKWQTDFGFLTI